MSTGNETKYRAMKGQLPRKKELPDWSEEKFFSFLKFVQHFLNGDDLNVTKESVEAFQLRAMEESFWMEFNVRMDLQTTYATFTPVKFKMRLLTATRVVLGFLKSNPTYISNEMREILESSERLRWCLDPFKVKVTPIGAEIPVVDNQEVTDPGRANVNQKGTNLTLPEIQYHNAVLKLTSTLSQLIDGISPAEIKKMSADQRIKLGLSIVQQLHRTFNGSKPAVQVFKQLNIHGAGKDELERALMDYNNAQT